MQVILREDVPDLGIIGEVVSVKPGYARNYLIPRGLAVVADSRNLKELEHQKRVIEAKRLKERTSHQAVADALQGVQLEVEVRAGRGGKLFGSVTNLDIKRMLEEKGFDIDRRRIQLREPIKEIGDYEVRVRVGQDVDSAIKVAVKPLAGQLEDVAVDEQGATAAPAEPRAAPETAEADADDDAGSEDVPA